MSASKAGPWWRELLPRRRRGQAPAIVLPDGSTVPSSFAAAVLGRRERADIERRRRGLDLGPEETPGRLGRVAWGAGLRPSVDSLGPRAEALMRAWLGEVDKEPPEVLSALESGDRVAFLLRGWISPRTFPGSPIREPAGTVVSFRALRGLEPSGLSGGTALVAASVRGSLLPRLRPSPAVAADGLLVPVGFAEEGCLYLPLLGTPVAVSGERSAELLAALAVYAQMRMGPEGCRVLATEPLRPLLDPVVLAKGFESTQPGDIARALHELALHRGWEVFDAGALTNREVALSPTTRREPIVLAFLNAETARQAKDEMPDLAELGVGVLIWGEVDAPRWISVSDQKALVCAGPNLEPLAVAPALLSGEAMAEAAVVLRSALGAVRAEPAPPGSRAPVAAPTPAAKAPNAEARAAEPARAREQAEPTTRRRIVSLGGLRVFLGPDAVEGGWRKKALELLALLAARPEGLTREQVLTALWPDDDPARSGASLRQCLRQIRKRLEASEEETMVADWVDERLRLDAGAVWSDVRAFEDALEEARRATEPTPSLRRAVDLYKGPFCDGHYYEWTLQVRERLQRRFLDASAELAELLGQDDRFDEALRVLDQAVEQEPFAEHLCRLAIELEGRRGWRTAARRRYEALKRLLAEELGTEPTEETEAVYRRLGRS
ncbi:MAG: AfsR/SARP family transcriptional regulator [Actinomycetota bacterium]